MRSSRRGALRLRGLSVMVLILMACLLGSSPSGGAGRAGVTQANYELAGRFTANSLRSMFVDTTVHPVWIDNGGRFWYMLRDGTAMRFFLVDVKERAKTELEVRLKLLGPNLVEFTVAGTLSSAIGAYLSK